ncbi:hypothetical protein D3C72_1496820 [compost metagenome]
MALQELQDRVGGDVRRLVRDHPHLDAREHQERAEQIEQPAKVADQRGAQANHDGAQHDHAQDAPEQHAVLVLAGNREEAENQRDHEDVVHRQRLFDHEAGVVGHAAGGAQLPPDPGAKQQRGADVAGRQQQAFAYADLAVFLVQHAQVEDQQADDDANEEQPAPGWRAEEIGVEEGDQSVHECPARFEGTHDPDLAQMEKSA